MALISFKLFPSYRSVGGPAFVLIELSERSAQGESAQYHGEHSSVSLVSTQSAPKQELVSSAKSSFSYSIVGLWSN